VPTAVDELDALRRLSAFVPIELYQFAVAVALVVALREVRWKRG